MPLPDCPFANCPVVQAIRQEELARDAERSEFIHFIRTFSDLHGSLHDAAMVVDFIFEAPNYEIARNVLDDSLLLVQIDALQDLYKQGVESADEWLEETTVDFLDYGRFWIKYDPETETMYNYKVVDDELVRFEPNIEPIDSETKVLRQMLLFPHTTRLASIDDNLSHTAGIQPLNIHHPLVNPTLVPDAQIRSTSPYRYVGRLDLTFNISPGARSEASGFLARTASSGPRSLVVTAAHNLYNPFLSQNPNNTNNWFRVGSTFTLALESNGQHQGRAQIAQTWIDSFWFHLRPYPEAAVLCRGCIGGCPRFGADQAIMVFPANTFNDIASQRLLLLPNWMGGWESPGVMVRGVGYTSLLGGRMGRANGVTRRRVMSCYVGDKIAHTLNMERGSSGGPLLDTQNRVVAITVGFSDRYGPVSVLITQYLYQNFNRLSR